MAEFYVEQQYWKHWPKVLIMCRKNGRDVTHRRYVPEVETGEGMGITEELREYATVSWDPWPEARDRLLQMCDRIDAEHERAMGDKYLNGVMDGREEAVAEWDCAHVKLPMDADGEPIRLRDVMESESDCTTFSVASIDYGQHPDIGEGDFWMLWSADGYVFERADQCHHHAPTVEDVLREFALAVCKDDALTIREGVVEEFAKRLTLAEGEDA